MSDNKSSTKCGNPKKVSVSRKRVPPVLPPCKVCGDKGTGLHYGVTTCVACKGFFQRSLTRLQAYECLTGTDQCLLGSHCGRRRACPKCRLDKCYAAGMSKDAIKIGRYSYEKKTQDAVEILKLSKTSEVANEVKTGLECLTTIDETSTELKVNNDTCTLKQCEEDDTLLTLSNNSSPECFDGEKLSSDFTNLDISRGYVCKLQGDYKDITSSPGDFSTSSYDDSAPNSIHQYDGEPIYQDQPPNFLTNTKEKYPERSREIEISDTSSTSVANPRGFDSPVDDCTFSTKDMTHLMSSNICLPSMSYTTVSKHSKLALKRKLAASSKEEHPDMKIATGIDGPISSGGINDDRARLSKQRKYVMSDFFMALDPMQSFISSEFPFDEFMIETDAEKNHEYCAYQQSGDFYHEYTQTPFVPSDSTYSDGSPYNSQTSQSIHCHGPDMTNTNHMHYQTNGVMGHTSHQPYDSTINETRTMFSQGSTPDTSIIMIDQQQGNLSSHGESKMTVSLHGLHAQPNFQKAQEMSEELKELASCKIISLELFLLQPFIENATGFKLDFNKFSYNTPQDSSPTRYTLTEETAPNYLTDHELLQWCEYSQSDLEGTISTLMRGHKATIGTDMNNMPQSDILRKRDFYLKLIRVKEAIFGQTTLCDLESYFEVLDTVGLDIDKRGQFINFIIPVYELYIHKVVKFIKCIPGFKSLPNEDKMFLAKESLSFCYILGNCKGIDIQNNLYIDQYNIARDFTEFKNLHQSINQILMGFKTLSYELTTLGLGYEDIVILKAVMTTWPEIGPVQDAEKIQKIHKKLLCCLYLHLMQHYSDYQEKYSAVLDWVYRAMSWRKVRDHRIIQFFIRRLVNDVNAPLFREIVTSSGRKTNVQMNKPSEGSTMAG